MFYIIYKTTNLVNNKYYIGKHQTKNINDGYFGSGKRLKQAIQKYGKENFITEILHVFDEEWKMNLAERILVTPDIETNYNLCSGGRGGFSFINRIRDHKKHNLELASKRNYKESDFSYITDSFRKKQATKAKNRWKNGVYTFIPNTKGFKYSSQSKQKMSEHQSGEKNSQFGTMWITNGTENKKIKKSELDKWIEFGYYKGRIC